MKMLKAENWIFFRPILNGKQSYRNKKNKQVGNNSKAPVATKNNKY